MAGIRLFWLLVGVVALAAASIGIVLPLIPTTPFVLLAAFAFMKSSKRLHDWLLQHKVFGKLIADWRQYGAISRQAKLVSIGSMAAIFILSVIMQVPATILLIQAIVLAACIAFIASRPLPPERSSTELG